MTESLIADFIDRKLSQPAQQQTHEQAGERDVVKGLLAGLVGGIVATAAKSLAEKVYPPRINGEPEPPAVLAEKIAGHELSETSKAAASEGIHWTFGAAAGAAYGALAEYYPAATAREGASFGMTLMALTHEGALPAMGLTAEPANQSTREKSSEMVTHVVFGIVVETVRRFVRSWL